MEHRPDQAGTNRITRHRLGGVASAYVETYMTPGGTKPGRDGKVAKPQKRYRVRARAGKSGARLLHLGSFPKRNLADKRKEWAEELLAQGITPRLEMLFVTDEAPTLTVSAAIERYLEQRPDLSDGTVRTYRSLVPHITRAMGTRDVASVSPDDVRELIRACSAAKLGADATRSIRGILAGALDNAGISPNPVRDRTVRLPSRGSRRMDVPPAEHVQTILEHLPAELVLPVALLEATGARVSELCAVAHADVDHERGRLRLVGKGDKPRLVPLPPELGALMPRVANAKRATAGRVWPGLKGDKIRKAMEAACVAGKIPHYTPHKLRHRYASRHVLIGTPITQISAYLGHAKTSMTHDVYAKVLDDGDTAEAWRSVVHANS